MYDADELTKQRLFSSMLKIPIVILISGNGSNLQAIIDAIENKQLDAEIKCVISNKPDAYGLIRAQNHQIPTEVVEKKAGDTRESYDQRLSEVIDQYQPKLCVLAGFMRILSQAFVQKYQGQIINIHPSLLPKYPGLDTHQQVLANGDKVHGCTIHYVTEVVDAGPIITKAQLNVLPDDTPERLKQRIHVLEHEIYPLAIQKICNELKKSS